MAVKQYCEAMCGHATHQEDWQKDQLRLERERISSACHSRSGFHRSGSGISTALFPQAFHARHARSNIFCTGTGVRKYSKMRGVCRRSSLQANGMTIPTTCKLSRFSPRRREAGGSGEPSEHVLRYCVLPSRPHRAHHSTRGADQLVKTAALWRCSGAVLVAA